MTRIFTLILALLLPLQLHAEDPQAFSYSAFSQIPILHEGRIKPLGSFARVLFKQINGHASPEHASAIQWLAHALFKPSEAMNERIFFVQSDELVKVLSLPVNKNRYYNFSEMAAAFADHQSLFETLASKNKKAFTPQEQKLSDLYNNVNNFADILGTFSLLVPLTDVDNQTLEYLGVNDHSPATYLYLLKFRREIRTKELITLTQKADHIETYTPTELGIARLTARITLLEKMDKNNSLLRIIPPYWEGTEEWLAPWSVINKDAGSPLSATLFADWQALAMAYQQDEKTEWQEKSQKLLMRGQTRPGVRPWALALEVFYNDFNFLNKVFITYIVALGLAIAGLLRRSSRLQVFAYRVMALGATLHCIMIVIRMAILMRPPVSTLYESMVFVSLIAIVFGLRLEWRIHRADGLIISSFVACLLLAAANVFAGNSDSLEVLVAVLNTNFWLATHVVCITTGYGSSLVAGTLAQLYLFKRAIGRVEERDLIALQRRIHLVALIALFFTSVGTMLGGIWADQSWGRFWGWDPKENGALWIVLWLIWLIHGRIAGQLGHLGFAVGMAFINIVVALAWVGVNLLNVGLHSYGFTDLAANSLFSFCAFELVFIAITTIIIRRQKTLSGYL